MRHVDTRRHCRRVVKGVSENKGGHWSGFRHAAPNTFTLSQTALKEKVLGMSKPSSTKKVVNLVATTKPTGQSPAQAKAAVPQLVTGTPATAAEAAAASTTVTRSKIQPYRFTTTDEKGSKALTRFRENLRQNYPDCFHLKDGLSMRDTPFLELYCYDPATENGYCRLHRPFTTAPFSPVSKSCMPLTIAAAKGNLWTSFNTLPAPKATPTMALS